MNTTLFSFREFRKLEQEDVAKELALALEEYKNLESGLDKVDAETALKLSQLYQVPPQIFLANDSSAHLSIIYTHCHFENSNGYVNHLYQHDCELMAKEETIRVLKEEVKRLQEQNEDLIKLLLYKKEGNLQ